MTWPQLLSSMADTPGYEEWFYRLHPDTLAKKVVARQLQESDLPFNELLNLCLSSGSLKNTLVKDCYIHIQELLCWLLILPDPQWGLSLGDTRPFHPRNGQIHDYLKQHSSTLIQLHPFLLSQVYDLFPDLVKKRDSQ
jgi:hypothetical protein